MKKDFECITHRENVETEIDQIILNRPEVLNALNAVLIGELLECLGSIRNRSDCKVVVFSGAGDRAFSAGADLKERGALNKDEWKRSHASIEEIVRQMLALPPVLIAAVEGYALGGGFELALLCDFIFASEESVFGFPEVSLGIIPGMGGTQTLSRKVGYSRATELIISGRRISGREAYLLGIIEHQTPKGSALSEALKMARHISAYSDKSVITAKKAIRDGLNVSLADGLKLSEELYDGLIHSVEARKKLDAFNG